MKLILLKILVENISYITPTFNILNGGFHYIRSSPERIFTAFGQITYNYTLHIYVSHVQLEFRNLFRNFVIQRYG